MSSITTAPKIGLIFDNSDLELAKEIAGGLEKFDIGVCPIHELVPGQHAGYSMADLYDELFHRELLACAILFTNRFRDSLAKEDTLRSFLFEARRNRENYLVPVQASTGDLPPVLSGLKHFDLATYGVVGLVQTLVSRLPAVALAAQPYALSPYPDIKGVIAAGEPTRALKPVGEPTRSPTENVGFEVYVAENPDRPLRDHQFYLHLHRNTSLDATADAFKKFASEHKISLDRLVVLLDKEPGVRRPEDRLRNVRALFTLDNEDVYYIDEYLFKFSRQLDKSSLHSKWSISNYVPAHITTNYAINLDALAHLKNWSLAPNKPVLAIKAPGGIGKTTLIRHFANSILDLASTRLVYAEAATIIDNLSKVINPPTIRTLQDLFMLCMPIDAFYSPHPNVEELVRINYDHGKLFFIIDGLDELISRLDLRFEVAPFLQSLHDSTKSSGLGKVLVTCRDYFWDFKSAAFNDLIESCELQPFDLAQAEIFFDNEFDSNEYPDHLQLRKRAMEEVMYIQGSGATPTFLPYILEVVANIMKEPGTALFHASESESPEEGSAMNNSSQEITIDHVAVQLCQREILRFHDAALPIAEQMRVLATLAAEETGPRFRPLMSHERTFSDVCFEALGRQLSDRQVENLKAHILLESRGETARFRYDFFQDYFIQNHLREFLKSGMPITGRETRLIGIYFDYGSSFLRTFVDTVTDDLATPEVEYRVLSVIEYLLARQSSAITPSIDVFSAKRALAGILNLMLTFVSSSGALNVDRATNIARLLFGRTESGRQVIHGMCVRNISSASGRPVTFDFRGTYLTNCSFENYEYFWRCRFDDGTSFERCQFIHVGRAFKSDLKAVSSNFGNDNVFDEDARTILEEMRGTVKRTSTQIAEGLVRFLSFFRSSSGTYTDKVRNASLQREHFSKLKLNISYVRFIDLLTRSKLIEKCQYRGYDCYQIRPTALVAVTRLIEQGLFSGATSLARHALERELLK